MYILKYIHVNFVYIYIKFMYILKYIHINFVYIYIYIKF